MISAKHALIFTDLDGTLLDHHTYSFEAALPVLSELSSLNIPVIPNTSKTAAELNTLRQTLSLTSPFIIENGAAIYLPKAIFPLQPKDCVDDGDYWIKTFVASRLHWINILKKFGAPFAEHYTPMSEMSIDEVVQATGLTQTGAMLAADRDFGEPLIWYGNDTEKQALIKALTLQGANVLEGGRFMHVCGHCDKGNAMSWLKTEYEKLHGTTYSTIALGDGNNDIDMLKAAQQAVIIRSPVNEPPIIGEHPNLIHSEGYGPVGWADTLTQILSLNITDQKDSSHG